MSLFRSSIVIGSLTMVSRVFGFVRDILIAGVLGASWLSDAFFVAFKLPNFFRRLFAEGAFNAAFVPQFAGLLSTDGRQTALAFAGQAFSFLLLALLALNALFLTFMPFLLGLFAPGFMDTPDKYALTVELARICFPYILFISLVALLGGILNATGRFAAGAAAPILLNLCLIAALLFLPAYMPSPAHALSWGVFAAGLLQLIWLGVFAVRARVLPAPARPRLSAPIRRFFLLVGPAALGAGVVQVNLLIDIVLGSLFPEGVSYLYYADRLNELPIGVIGVAVGTALLPMLSGQLKTGQTDAARHSLNRALELVLLFGLPAAVALMVIPEALITVLYERGAFTPEDTQATYRALMAYAAGLPAFLLVKVLAPGFYAQEDTKTPFQIALICVGVNLVLNLLLMQVLAHVGLALATSLAAWLNAALMARILRRRGILQPDRSLIRRVPRFALAACVMGTLLWGLSLLCAPLLDGDSIRRIGALTLLVGGGVIAYGGLVLLSRAVALSEMKTYLRKQQH